MADVAVSQDPDQHALQCMDIWSGNRSIENRVSTPGLDYFIFSQPFRGERSGGDVHYLSLCAGGATARLILADVSGHGAAVETTSQMLRGLMRRFMNHKSQTRLVRELNREFTLLNQSGRFATAVVATYLGSGHRVQICNAGHPRPLSFTQATQSWSFMQSELTGKSGTFNLPLGIDETAAYQQFRLELAEGDVLVFYTDAITEASRPDGSLLGEEGLLELVQGISCDDVRSIGQDILKRLKESTANVPSADDLTLIVVRYSHSKRRFPGILERLRGYAKVLGLKPV